MAKLLDQLLVIDIESTCWQGPAPAGQHSDVIEIGVTLLDLATLTRGGKRSLLIAPTRSRVSAFCTELTTLRPEDVAHAGSLEQACRVIRRDYDSRDRAWASFGDYDRRQLRRNCEALGVGFPFGPTHLNVKHLAALVAGEAEEPSLLTALTRFGLRHEGTHHRGDDDAFNVAGLLAAILGRLRAAAPPGPAGGATP
jgi:inhibitor of KinA sporulation pathway (predicted exonuclease)